MQNKCIDCSPRVCFYNNHPEAIQHTTVSNQYCRQCEAHPSEQDDITSPEWEKKQNKKTKTKKPYLQFSVSHSCPNSSRYKNARLRPSTDEHPTSQLFALCNNQ